MLAQHMIARLILRPAGLVKQAWASTLAWKTMRRTATVADESLAVVAPLPPTWPYRYRGAALSLFAAEPPVAANAPSPMEPQRADTAALGKRPFTSGYLAYDDHAASFLESHAC